MEECSTLALRIKLIRKHFSFSQEAFGKVMDCCKSSIINYESGIRIPGAEFLIQIVQLFNVNPEWLLMGKGEMTGYFPLYSAKGEKDEDLHQLLEHLQIPIMKMAIMAEYSRLKSIFKPIIDEFDSKQEHMKKIYKNG